MRYEYLHIRGGGIIALTQEMQRLGDAGVEIFQIDSNHRPGDRFLTWEIFARHALPSSPAEQSDYGYGPNSVDPADRQELEAEKSSDAQLIYETEQKLSAIWLELCDIRDKAVIREDVRDRLVPVCRELAIQTDRLTKRREGR